MKTTLNLKTLKAVALAAEQKNRARFYLQGVLVECSAGAVTYVATNSHILLAAHEALPDLEPGEEARLTGSWIIPLAVIKAAKVSAGRFSTDTAELVQMGGEPGRESFSLAGQLFQMVDCTFPDWRRLLPGAVEPLKGEPAQFDPANVAIFGKAAEMLGYGKSRIHYTGDGECAHAVTMGGGGSVFGVIMPYRNPGEPWSGAPAWAQHAKEEAQS